jgi:predicted naringenin-chalcone synthase
MAKIVAIGTAVPKYGMGQMQIADFMEQLAGDDPAVKRKLRLLYERSGIQTRHSVVPDYNRSLGQRILYPQTPTLEPFPAIEQRMNLYQKFAAPLAYQAILDCGIDLGTQPPTHLITVSCTGMSAPGLDLELVSLLNLPSSIERTSVNFMGCYAAVHALKLARAICNSRNDARVLVVSVELCTLHFQKTRSDDNLTANALFADGAAACWVVSDGLADQLQSTHLVLEHFYSEIIPDGKKDMAWQLSSTGFLMTLSAYIPQLIQSNIASLFQKALLQSAKHKKDISMWAIHPGGRKILEVIASQLMLEEEALAHSYEVLKAFGNMSSATILFVLKRFMDDQQSAGTGFGAAFGPGLTLETFIFTKYQ